MGWWGRAVVLTETRSARGRRAAITGQTPSPRSWPLPFKARGSAVIGVAWHRESDSAPDVEGRKGREQSKRRGKGHRGRRVERVVAVPSATQGGTSAIERRKALSTNESVRWPTNESVRWLFASFSLLCAESRRRFPRYMTQPAPVCNIEKCNALKQVEAHCSENSALE